jgi:hypothetical protein
MNEQLKNQLIDILKPFVEAKVHNPNNSPSVHTKRTLNVKAIDLASLKACYAALTNNKDLPVAKTIENAWIVYFELHVDDRTFIVNRLVYAYDKKGAEQERDKLKSEHGNNYHLQLKGGPFKLENENLWMLSE